VASNGTEEEKDNAEAQSSRRLAEESLRREAKQKIGKR
jgi:hypothetical protein